MSFIEAAGHTVQRGGQQQSGAGVALQQEGKPRRRLLSLFDIVGQDEGTCGRRPRVRRPQGVGTSVKARPFSQVLHVSIRKNFCAERLLEMSGLIRAFHLDLVVHKLESLIMAQNERWRHA